MKRQRNDLKAGLFIVISIALVIAVVVGIKGASQFLTPTSKHAVRFALADNIGGLSRGDPVRIGGAKVGSVRDIQIDIDSQVPGIVVTFEVPRRFTLHKDAIVNIESTVTGVSVLNFEALGHDATLADGDMLAGRPSSSISSFLTGASGFIADARTTTLPKVNSAIDTYKTTGDHATTLVDMVKEKVNPIVERYNSFADSGKSALDQIGALFGDTKPDFRGTLAHLNKITGDIQDKLPDILKKVDGVLTKIQVALDKTNNALVDIQQTAADARATMGSARSILTSNRGKIDSMINSLKSTGDNLKAASSEIRRSPWRLLYKPSPGEVANLNIYDSTRQFADGANSLEDAAEALRDAAKDPATDQKKLQQLLDQLNKAFDNFSSVESELWKKVQQ